MRKPDPKQGSVKKPQRERAEKLKNTIYSSTSVGIFIRQTNVIKMYGLYGNC